MTPARLPTALVLVMLLLFYLPGLTVVVTPDSPGYLDPAYKLVAPGAPTWIASRTLGYPLLLFPLVNLPAPALAIGLTHILIVLAGYALLRNSIRSALPILTRGTPQVEMFAMSWLTPLLAVTALYGALHALIGSVMPEIALATTALVAVVAVQQFALAPAMPALRLVFYSGIAAIPAAAAMTLKPHWWFAGPFLALCLSVCTALAIRRFEYGWLARTAALLAATLVPLGVVMSAVLLDRQVVSVRGDPASQTFGARSAFCNNAHLIWKVAVANPGLQLAPEPQADAELKTFLTTVVPPGLGKWALLGYDGDTCLAAPQLQEMLERLNATTSAEQRLYSGALSAAVVARPDLFLHRVVVQMAFSLGAAFNRPAMAMKSEPGVVAAYFGSAASSSAFFQGTRNPGAAGLLAWSDTFIKSNVGRSIVRAVLVVVFSILGAAVALAALMTALAGPLLWRRWDAPCRLSYLLFLALPLGTILAHNLIIALVHTFDIWRYSYDMFFVHLMLLINSAAFFVKEAIIGRFDGLLATMRGLQSVILQKRSG